MVFMTVFWLRFAAYIQSCGVQSFVNLLILEVSLFSSLGRSESVCLGRVAYQNDHSTIPSSYKTYYATTDHTYVPSAEICPLCTVTPLSRATASHQISPYTPKLMRRNFRTRNFWFRWSSSQQFLRYPHIYKYHIYINCQCSLVSTTA